jgi:1-deoxy-D-xylulose-5-phosphate synthase
MKLSEYRHVNDLKQLSNTELAELAGDLRAAVIKECEEFEGHLGSNLAVVELTISLLRHFGFQNTRYLFDTSYQAYSFKRLTDRPDFYDLVHSPDGYSIFQEIGEGDPFSGGHTSISAAWAAGYNFVNDEKQTIEIMGDGALATSIGLGGMLNFAKTQNKGLFILNDNKQGIGVNPYDYLDWKAIATGMKYTYFEVDGHDFDAMEQIWTAYDKATGPVFVKANTIKALGYEKPFNHDEALHYIDFNAKPTPGKISSFKILKEEMYQNILEHDQDALFFVAGFGYGYGLEKWRRQYPNRVMEVGISEEIALIEAAAAANAGKHPYLFMGATFFQRCYDQIVHDVIRNSSNITIVIVNASITNIGDSHHGIYDLNMYNAFENVQVFCPSSKGEMHQAFVESQKYHGPKAIRLQGEVACDETVPSSIYNWNHIKHGGKKVVISYHDFFHALEDYVATNKLPIDVVNATSLNPIDEKLIQKLIDENYTIYTYEHTFWKNNLASSIRAHFPNIIVKDYSFKNIFIGRWGMKEMMERNEMDLATVTNQILSDNKD